MSELMDELKSNLEDSSQNLEKLISEIQGMADSEKEFSELKGSIGDAAKALSSNATKYEEFLSELKNSNQKFSDTLATLKSLEPKEIKDQLENLNKSSDTLNKSFEKLESVTSDILDTIHAQSQTAEKESESVRELLNAQSQKLNDLEKRVKSRTALVPLIFLGILALAGAIGGRILGLV